MKTRLILLSALIATFLSCWGCGFFEPRNPETPGGGGVPWIPPTEPDTLFVNIKNAMEGKVIANYQRSLVDPGFVFHPDPSDSIDLLQALSQDVYVAWDLDVELQVTQTIFDEASAMRLTFTKRDTTIFLSSEERIYFYKYELQVLYKVGGSDTFRGFVDYYVRSSGGLWYIYMWLDKRDPDYPPPNTRTWGNYKGTKRVITG
jgi:hypothetical protein